MIHGASWEIADTDQTGVLRYERASNIQIIDMSRRVAWRSSQSLGVSARDRLQFQLKDRRGGTSPEIPNNPHTLSTCFHIRTYVHVAHFKCGFKKKLQFQHNVSTRWLQFALGAALLWLWYSKFRCFKFQLAMHWCCVLRRIEDHLGRFPETYQKEEYLISYRGCLPWQIPTPLSCPCSD